VIPDLVIDRLQKFQPKWSPTMFKATLVGMIAMAFVVPLGLVAVPFIEFLNGMAAQPKGKAQMTFGRTYDPAGFGWRVERRPVPGTLPRGYFPYEFDHLGNTTEESKLVGESLGNPLDVTVESMKKGQELYGIFCVPCHGAQGHGDGPVIGPDRFPAPPSLHTDQARDYRDGTIYHILTKGQNKMPSYAPLLEPTERWQVILYLRALQRAENPTEEDRK
jgi:hypothetical protein